MRLTITKQHINEAKRLNACGDPNRCVVAQALRDRFPDEYIAVTYRQITVKSNDTPRKCTIFRPRNPTRFEDFLSEFDNGRDVSPSVLFFDEIGQ